MNAETKKLITAGMLSEVFNDKCENVVITNSGKIAFHSLGYEFRITEAEMSNMLEEWAVNRLNKNMMFKCTFGGLFKLWEVKFCDFDKCHEVELGETKLEALLKLYHAVKGET